MRGYLILVAVVVVLLCFGVVSPRKQQQQHEEGEGVVILDKTGESASRKGWITYDQVRGGSYSVSYDNRSLKINGLPSLFVSGSVHPPRLTPPMWDPILATAASNGLNMVEVYVFWNFHEREEGKFYWEERGNLSLFIEKCAEHNLFVNLRIGPYVCAEWDYGGIPAWLGFKQGIQFRTYNDVWMKYMGDWFRMVINRMQPYFAKYGGPIVLVQVENELSAESGTNGRKYIDWCGNMANDAVKDFAVPIIMCNGDSAPNTINTCNANDCDWFIEQHGQSGRILIDQPALWTENEGGFQAWGESPSNTFTYFWGRTSSDISGAIARWFARGGSHMNYYMYYGGNHYGTWAGSSITNMYASDVNVCPDTLPHEPKFSHLGRLHSILANYADVIAYSPAQMGKEQHLLWYDNQTRTFQPGTQQIAYIYKQGNKQLTFIENDANVWVLTQFNGKNYDMPPTSVSLVDQTGTELYNTGKISPAKTTRITGPVDNIQFHWKVWSEPFSSGETSHFPSLSANYPVEQSLVIHQLPSNWPWTQYMWYERNVTISNPPASSASLELTAEFAEGFLLFVDGVLVGVTDDHNHTEGTRHQIIRKVGKYFTRGTHQIAILSESFGFNNGMDAGSTRKSKGITGSVRLDNMDLTNGKWVMRPALVGEQLQVFTPSGSKNVEWSTNWRAATGKPVTWYQTTFSKPDLQSDVLLLDARGMGRGHFYLNGRDMGRYWLLQMNDGSKKATQHLYHIPTDWLVDGTNLLTFGEILGASDPTLPRLMRRRMVAGNGGAHDVTCPM